MKIRKVLNMKYIFIYLFLILIAVFTNEYYKSGKKPELGYSIVFLLMGLTIAAFYIVKDMIYNPSRMNYRNIIMEKALFNHRGKILKEVDSVPLHKDFIALYLGRNSEDPYGATVSSLQAVRYKGTRMVDSLFVPIESRDPLFEKYSLSIGEAFAKFIKFADTMPVVTYNQAFMHTYINIKLDKDIQLTYLDAMKMSKDIYNLYNEPIKKLTRHLRLINLENDRLAGAKTVGAIYLDYVYTLTVFKAKEKKRLQKLIKGKSGGGSKLFQIPEKARKSLPETKDQIAETEHVSGN